MYYDTFIESDLGDLGDIQFLPNIEYKYGVEDWRNIATNYMLKFSDSEWVCSVEQDFFARDWERICNVITEASGYADFIGYKGHQGQEGHQVPYLTGDYVHPSFWFIKRSLLDKTSKNFSADPVKGADHFGLITQDVEKMKLPIWYLQNNEIEEWRDCFHLGGVNQNYLEGLKKDYAFHRPEIFYVYNYWSQKVPVKQDTQFLDLMQRIQNTLSKQLPNMESAKKIWKPFFV